MVAVEAIDFRNNELELNFISDCAKQISINSYLICRLSLTLLRLYFSFDRLSMCRTWKCRSIRLMFCSFLLQVFHSCISFLQSAWSQLQCSENPTLLRVSSEATTAYRQPKASVLLVSWLARLHSSSLFRQTLVILGVHCEASQQFNCNLNAILFVLWETVL